MPTTYSTSLRTSLIATGELAGTWGTVTNTNIGTLLEQAITGVGDIIMVDADRTLTAQNAVSDESRNAVLRVTSSVALTATRQIIIPNVDKVYVVINTTTGSQSIRVQTATPTSYVDIPNGYAAFVSCDGSAVVSQATASYNPATNAVTATTILANTVATSYASGGPLVSLETATAQNKYIRWTTSGSTRWDVGASNAAESGSNAGSNFFVNRYTDAGVIIDSPLSILRSSGRVSLINGLTISGALTYNGLTLSTAITGTGMMVLDTSPTLTTPSLGTPSSVVLTSATGLPLATGVTGTLPVANGGTGVTTSTGSGNNVLSTSPTLTTPALGTPSAAVLTSATGLPLTTGVTGTLPVANGGTGVTTLTNPTTTVYTSGSGTYTTPAGVKWLLIRMVGGGGGGAGSGTIGLPGGAGGTGGTSTFGSSYLTTTGGAGGAGIANGAAGGTATGGDFNLTGGISGGANFVVSGTGGNGGQSAFGGGAGVSASGNNGQAGATNTGGGGSGGATSSAANGWSGNGGGAGGYLQKIVSGPSATYAYAVGAAGVAGTASTAPTSFAGGAGGSGIIIIEEHYLA